MRFVFSCSIFRSHEDVEVERKVPVNTLRNASILTSREREVANAICRGLSNKEIARELEIAVPTVKRHASAIMSKLRVCCRAKLILLWLADDSANAEQT